MLLQLSYKQCFKMIFQCKFFIKLYILNVIAFQTAFKIADDCIADGFVLFIKVCKRILVHRKAAIFIWDSTAEQF